MVSSIPLRHSTESGLSVTGVQLVVPDHALELPVLPALSLSTCPRYYPGAATGGTSHPLEKRRLITAHTRCCLFAL